MSPAAPDVLLVDDDEAVLAWESAVLAQEGYAIRTARDGAEALSAIEARVPDLVLLDLLLPDLDGFVLHALIRERSSLPVLVVSVVPSGGESVLRGACGFVQKPPDPEALLAAVRQALGEPSRPTSVLVVDDDEPTRALYRTVLELKTPYAVVEAADGLEALGRLRADPSIRLVITDVHMPEMNGVELVRAMRGDERLRELPVIVQTSDSLMARSGVWAELNVEQAMDKDDFRRWLRETVTRRVPRGSEEPPPAA